MQTLQGWHWLACPQTVKSFGGSPKSTTPVHMHHVCRRSHHIPTHDGHMPMCLTRHFQPVLGEGARRAVHSPWSAARQVGEVKGLGPPEGQEHHEKDAHGGGYGRHPGCRPAQHQGSSSCCR